MCIAKRITENVVSGNIFIDAIQASSVADGANHEMRDYSVSIDWDKDMKELAIWVQGKLFLE